MKNLRAIIIMISILLAALAIYILVIGNTADARHATTFFLLCAILLNTIALLLK